MEENINEGQIFSSAEKTKFIQFIELGYGIQEACGLLQRSSKSYSMNVMADSIFYAAVKQAQKFVNNEVVERAVIELATGAYETVTERYVPMLDAGKNPIMLDGKTCVRLYSRVVRKHAPKVEAQKLWLEANKPELYKKDAAPSQNVEVMNVDPSELEKIISDRVESLNKD